MTAFDPGGFAEDRPGPRPAAVLFDMDGTLLDSEPLWAQAETQLIRSYGGEWGPEQAEELIGWSLWDAAGLLRERFGIPLTEAEIIDRMQGHVIAGVGRSAPWQPGALELLARVRAAGVPAALVTMSHHELSDVVVAALPEGSFETVVSGDQVRRGKPAPDPYLLAADRLGVAASDCVAIEDSVTGATSARDAGCTVLVVPSAGFDEALTGVRLRSGLVGLSLADLSQLLTEHRAEQAQSGATVGSSIGVSATG